MSAGKFTEGCRQEETGVTRSSFIEGFTMGRRYDEKDLPKGNGTNRSVYKEV